MENEKRFARQLYWSRPWAICRKRYAESVGGLCERCYAEGRITPGVHVHHKIRLTPENISNPEITLNWKNLELLCEECHQKEHRRPGRFRVDEEGHVLMTLPGCDE